MLREASACLQLSKHFVSKEFRFSLSSVCGEVAQCVLAALD